MTRMLRFPVLALSLWLLALMVVPNGAARAQEREVDVELFYTELDQHGRWFEHRTYGYVWSPDVDPDWRPYTRGRWVMTEEHGWLWESDEPFGWAVFHYGRWFLDEDAGWVWVPGTVWGPAWVAWRTSDEQVGWAPLPPEAEWRGDAVHFSPSYYDRPRYAAAWCFVPVALLTSAVVYRHIYRPSRNVYFVRQTRWVPPLRGVGNRVINIGYDRHRYERITRRPLTIVRIVDARRPQDPRGPQDGRRPGSRNEIQIYRPRIVAPTTVKPPPRLVEPPRIRDRVPPTRQPQFIPPGTRQTLPPPNQPPPTRQPTTVPPPPRQPGTVPPPTTKQPQFLPPPSQPPAARQPPPTRQPTTVPPATKQPQFLPPPNQPPPARQPPPRQPTTVPPPVTKQPQFAPPPRQPTTVPPPTARPQAPPPPKAPPQQGTPPGKDPTKQRGRPPQPGEQPPVPR